MYEQDEIVKYCNNLTQIINSLNGQICNNSDFMKYTIEQFIKPNNEIKNNDDIKSDYDNDDKNNGDDCDDSDNSDNSDYENEKKHKKKK